MSGFIRVRNPLPFVTKRTTEETHSDMSPRCSALLIDKKYVESQKVCPRCGHHGRIGADERLRQLLDEGYDVLRQPDVAEDPLKFRDTKKYTDRLKQARAKNPHKDAFTVGSGAIEGR